MQTALGLPTLPRGTFSIPTIAGPILDQADFFSPPEESQLTQVAQSLRAFPGPQVVVWTVPSLGGNSIEEVSLKAAEQWRLGDASRDDGILLIMAASERRLRIEVGQGLEGPIPDVVAFRQIEKILKPALRAQNPARGTLEWMIDVGSRTVPEWRPDAGIVKDVQSRPPEWSSRSVFVILFLVIVILRILRSMTGGGGGGGISGRWSGGAGFGYGSGSRSGHSSGFGSFGGGGWSGGGGGFSGGGSSGSW